MSEPTREERAEYYRWSRYKIAGAVVLLIAGLWIYGANAGAGLLVMFAAVAIGGYYTRRVIHTARKMGE